MKYFKFWGDCVIKMSFWICAQVQQNLRKVWWHITILLISMDSTHLTKPVYLTSNPSNCVFINIFLLFTITLSQFSHITSFFFFPASIFKTYIQYWDCFSWCKKRREFYKFGTRFSTLKYKHCYFLLIIIKLPVHIPSTCRNTVVSSLYPFFMRGTDRLTKLFYLKFI